MSNEKTLECPVCGQVCKTAAGLQSHRRSKHKRWKGSNRRAAEAFLKGAVPAVSSVDAELLKTLSDLVDLDPTPGIVRAYMELLEKLERGAENAGNEATDDLDGLKSAGPSLGNLKAV